LAMVVRCVLCHIIEWQCMIFLARFTGSIIPNCSVLQFNGLPSFT
jgi:hypothetical protein